MFFKEERLNFNIVNNTSAIVPISFLGNGGDLSDIANQYTQYAWNLSGIAYNANFTISVQYKKTGAASFTTFSSETALGSINDLIAFLNENIGIGTFFNIGNYLYTYNDGYVFGNISINVAQTGGTFTWDIVTGIWTDAQIRYFNPILSFFIDRTTNDSGGWPYQVNPTYTLQINLVGTGTIKVFDYTANVYIFNTTGTNFAAIIPTTNPGGYLIEIT